MGLLSGGLHGLNTAYELSISKRFVARGGVGFGGGYVVNDDRNETYYGLTLAKPVFFTVFQGKYYTNMVKREERGKITSENSANFIGFQSKYTAGRTTRNRNDDLHESMLNELHWGIQRRLSETSRFQFQFHLGLGHLYDFDTEDDQVIPTTGAKFSYQILR